MALPDPQVHDFPGSQRNFDAVVKLLAAKANLASPTFTGDPKAPTAAPGDNDTSLATTAFVTAAIAAIPPSTSKVTTYPATVIPTSESRTNVAYGLLTTHDEVTGVVVPANALVLVYYRATWQESVALASRAAIFIGSNQLKAVAYSNSASPQPTNTVQDSGPINGAHDTPLATYSLGLATIQPVGGATNYAGDVTTGQAAGMIAHDTGVSGAALPATPFIAGGPCVITNLAAATYTISVQFKSTSGSVTVKNRALQVEVHDFS